MTKFCLYIVLHEYFGQPCYNCQNISALIQIIMIFSYTRYMMSMVVQSIFIKKNKGVVIIRGGEGAIG